MKARFLAAVFAAGCLFSTAAYAEAIETTATHAIMVDAGTGTVLLDKNASQHMPTSSMSKTMAMYMVFDALKKGKLKLTDELTVSEKAWRMQGSKMFVKVGDRVKVEDLIRGVLIQSGNDATVTLAEGLGGTEDAFVETMNEKAKELGMTNSHFMNASGWPDPNHYSTPRDLALLAFKIMNDFPEYYHYFGEKEYTYNNIHQMNRDPLLAKLPGADGLKTGHTDIAGYGLIGSAKRGDRRLIMVVNGLQSDKDRAEEGVRLMEWGFRNFENRQLVKKGETIDVAKVWLGKSVDVPLVADNDVNVVMPVAKRANMKINVSYMEPLSAPIKKGTPIAALKIEIPDQAAQEIQLLAGNDVERKGLFGRVYSRFEYLVMGTY